MGKRFAGKLFTQIVLLFFCVVIAFPFLWMITNSLKTKDEIWATPPQMLPAEFQWQNYTDALSDGSLLQYLWNSMYTAALITIIILINSSMFAYAITNIHFPGRTLLFGLVMLTYIMPSAATNIPAYVILSKMKLIDTHIGYIISCAASIFSIFYFRQMFMQISPSIKEAARVDGATHTTIMWRIIVPMSTSSFVTLGLLSFVGSYNSFVWPSLVLKTKSKFLISSGLRLFFSTDGAYGLKWGAIMAACCISVMPLLILFFIGQKQILNGITSDSALKE